MTEIDATCLATRRAIHQVTDLATHGSEHQAVNVLTYWATRQSARVATYDVTYSVARASNKAAAQWASFWVMSFSNYLTSLVFE